MSAHTDIDGDRRPARPISPLRPGDDPAAIAVAGQWTLIWRKFAPQQGGAASPASSSCCSTSSAIFAEFLAPGAAEHDPAAIHLRAAAGHRLLRHRRRRRPRVPAARQRLHDRGRPGGAAPHLRRSTQTRSSRSASSSRARPTRCGACSRCDLHLIGPLEPEPTRSTCSAPTGSAATCFSRLIYGTRVSMSIGLVGVAHQPVARRRPRRHLRLLRRLGRHRDPAHHRVVSADADHPALARASPRRSRSTWSPLQVYFIITAHRLAARLDRAGARGARPVLRAARARTSSPPRGSTASSELRLIFRHILPSLTSHIIAVVTLAIPTMIVAETALSFLGIGLKPPVVCWGVLLQDAQNIRTIATAPWLLIWPALAVVRGGARLQLPRRRPARRGRPLRQLRSTHGDAPSDDAVLDGARPRRSTSTLRTRILHAVDDVSFDLQRGQTLCLVGESGSGKSVTARALLQHHRQARPRSPAARSCSDGDGERSTSRRSTERSREIRAIRGRRIGLIFQEPMSSLSPVHTIGAQIIEVCGCIASSTSGRRARATIELLRQVEIPNPERDDRPLHLRVLRRHAAARDDRHGAGLQPRHPDRRRADHRARRHHPGRDPRPDQAAAGRARHGDAAHHPRHGRRRRGRRRGRGDALRPDRRARARSTTSSTTPQHPYTPRAARLDAEARAAAPSAPPRAAAADAEPVLSVRNLDQDLWRRQSLVGGKAKFAVQRRRRRQLRPPSRARTSASSARAARARPRSAG